MQSLDHSLLNILANKASGTVAIFERNEFFTCYEDDAYLVANKIFMSEVGLRRFSLGLQELTYQNLNSGQYNRVIRDVLLLLHYRLEVYAADEGEWKLKAKGSLGCLGDFEDIIEDSVELGELSSVMALVIVEEKDLEELHIFIGSCNIHDLRMTVAEFSDTHRFSNLERFLVSLMPREYILIPASSSLVTATTLQEEKECVNKLEAFMTRTGIQKIKFQSYETVTFDMENDLNRLISCISKDVHLSEQQKRCLVTLAQYLRLIDDESYVESFQLYNFKSSGYAYLNIAAVKALELFTVSYDEDGSVGETGTLYQLLNKCRTHQGRRLLRDWMRRPEYDLRRINERLDVVQALYNNFSCRSILYEDILRRIPDMGGITKKLTMKKAGLQDCYRLYQVTRLLCRLESVFTDLQMESDCLAPAINDLCLEHIRVARLQFDKFMALIETTLDLDYYEQGGKYRIKPEIDEYLSNTAEKMHSIEEDCAGLLDEVSTKVAGSVRLDSNAQYGFFFRVTLKTEKALRQMGFRVLDTSKGSGVRFTTSELDPLNAEYCELQKFYENAQSKLVQMVVETSAGYSPAFIQLSEVLAVIDVLVAFSVLAATSASKYTRPVLLKKGSGVLELIACRHPVLESLPASPYFVPNNVIMGNPLDESKPDSSSVNGKSDEARFLLLTGANMGGKSTYIRSCALVVLMAQIGSFVPCDSARISIVDGIHTRIGSCDYQFKGVSAFMAEMLDSASILESATDNSLIVIDELGRGTSTYDGFGLAWAIAEDLITRIKCFCIFATHFHEMAGLHDVHPKVVRNIKVDTHFDEEGQLTLLYKVVPGVAEGSFGLNIAKLVGLPESVLKHAGALLGEFEGKNESSDASKHDEILAHLKILEGEELREAIIKLLC